MTLKIKFLLGSSNINRPSMFCDENCPF